MAVRLIIGIATLVVCAQALLFIGPFLLFGELAMAAQRRQLPQGTT
jgi:hypothetical protein